MTTEIANNIDPSQQQKQLASTKQIEQVTQNASDLSIVSPTSNLNMKYPLENSWSFWFFKNEKSNDWKDNLVFITTVDFVEDFWGVYNHLQPVSKLNQGCDYMFF